MKNLISIIVLIGLYSFNPETKEHHQVIEKIEIDSTNTFIDKRDNTPYQIIELGNLIWFNKNLSFKSQHSESISSSPNDEEGRLYAFNDSKIACPEGWRLPMVKEFDEMISLIFNMDFYGQVTLDFNWETIANNQMGFNFDQTGFLHKKKYMSRESFNFWLDDSDEENAYHVHMYDTNKRDKGNTLTLFRHTHTKGNPKKNRKFAIRCVCEASTLD